jgi:hypothetical protein
MMDRLARDAAPPLCRFQKMPQNGREQGASDRAVGRPGGGRGALEVMKGGRAWQEVIIDDVLSVARGP